MNGASTQKRWTFLELLDWTTQFFEEAGIEDARLNAQLLLAKVAGVERIMLYAQHDSELTPEQRSEFRALVRRRADHCPVQYLLGEWEFYGRALELTPAVLVPRPETELLVEACLQALPGDGRDLTAADIGTGSGAIAVTLACERPGLRVAAVDASAEALEVAARNAERHGVADRIETACGDLCDGLPAGMRDGLTLIAANLPYVPSGQMATLQPEVRDYEPHQALDGGPDGLDAIRRLLAQAPSRLAEGGRVVLELGVGQADAVREIIAGVEGLDEASVETARDGICERVLAVRRTP